MNRKMNEPTIMTAAHTSLYGGAGLSVLGGLTANDVLALSGFASAVGGLCVQAYYKRKSDRREQNEERRKQVLHELEVAKRKKELQP